MDMGKKKVADHLVADVVKSALDENKNSSLPGDANLPLSSGIPNKQKTKKQARKIPKTKSRIEAGESSEGVRTINVASCFSILSLVKENFQVLVDTTLLGFLVGILVDFNKKVSKLKFDVFWWNTISCVTDSVCFSVERGLMNSQNINVVLETRLKENTSLSISLNFLLDDINLIMSFFDSKLQSMSCTNMIFLWLFFLSSLSGLEIKKLITTLLEWPMFCTSFPGMYLGVERIKFPPFRFNYQANGLVWEGSYYKLHD